jgi:putative transposase
MLARGIDSALQRYECDLLAFVFMPEHVHLLILPRQPETAMGSLLHALKRPVAYRIKQRLAAVDATLLNELTIRERPGKTTFRFWQEGGGYDRNITEWDALVVAADYIHANPVRRGLCRTAAEWKWSSFRFYDEPNAPPDPDLPHVHGFPT